MCRSFAVPLFVAIAYACNLHMNSPDDTIAALGTAPGEGGISVVRVSGPGTFAIADRVFRCAGAKPSSRPGGTFVTGHTQDAQGDVDEALLLIMRGPRSYTREDMVEIQGHGGNEAARRNLRLVLEAGARLAEPGEFTKRAFLSGRLDLLQAEAVLDLIRARSDRAASAALEQLEGHLSDRFNELYDVTVALLADLEASLDFPEDELPEGVLDGLNSRLGKLAARFEALRATWDEGHLLREGAQVVIIGRPNAGKSSLLNALLGKDRAIVSETPGTTRDTIEEGFSVGGVPLRLVDTAGMREALCDVEREGIRRTQRQVEAADLYLLVVDASQPANPEDLETLASLRREHCIVVLNKTDLGQGAKPKAFSGTAAVETCLLTGAGVQPLREAMADLLRREGHLSTEPRAVISERHHRVITEAKIFLEDAIGLLSEGHEDQIVIAASKIRDALEQLGTVTGRVYHDELLDSIFSRFCIGK